MQMYKIFHTFAIFLMSFSLSNNANAFDWDAAAKQVRQVSPSKFNHLPRDAVALLEKQGCTIPQPTYYTDQRKVNVISGSFAAHGQKDYAVLCSKNGVSHIQLIWGGSIRCPSKLQFGADQDYLQHVGNDEIAFSREIASASQKTISKYQAKFGGLKPKIKSHAGVEDIFIEKASSIFYCEKGKWLELSGTD
jgi:hypothetical protein